MPYIGVFDSGVGGLTVVRRMIEQAPDESLVFVADQAHVPYGGRPLDQVARFATAISKALIADGAGSLIMACNISTATALTTVRTLWPDHVVLGVIDAGADLAIRYSSTRSIGVIATEGTVSTGAYTRALKLRCPNVTVTEVACPAFVPLIESEQTDTPAAVSAARTYLKRILAARADVVILGCTHYPFMLPCLARIAPNLCFVDPATETVETLTACIGVNRRQVAAHSPFYRLLTTGDVSQFRSQVAFFMPDLFDRVSVGKATWDDEILCLYK